MNKKIIDGTKISEEFRKNLEKEIQNFPTAPELVDIQIGNDEASNIYINNKGKAASKIGIKFHHIKFDENTDKQIIIDKIIELNNDKKINGILLQLPLPENYDPKELINYIDPNKDVDGLTTLSYGNMFLGNDGLVSCTPSGVIYLLEQVTDLAFKNVVIVGRSNLVGKPLVELLLRKDATVTICHSKTINLKEYTRKADILIVAVGHKNLITEDMVKDNAIVIDVGISRVDGKIYGDVDFNNVIDKVCYITPVPGGVGPMTITMLLNNVVKSYKKMNNI